MVKSKTMTTESTIATTEQVTYDSDMMSAELDKIQLNKSQTIKGILRLVICSAIGIAAFFVSVPHNGKSEIIFSIIWQFCLLDLDTHRCRKFCLSYLF